VESLPVGQLEMPAEDILDQVEEAEYAVDAELVGEEEVDRPEGVFIGILTLEGNILFFVLILRIAQ